MDAQSHDNPDRLAENWTLAGRFVREVAHDINNHLGAILASAELFALGVGERQETDDLVEEIARCVRSSSALIDTLAAVVGRDLVTVETVDLREAAEHVLAIFRREADRSGVRLSASLPPGACEMAAVRTRIVRLLVHALRFEMDRLARGANAGELRVDLSRGPSEYQLRIIGSTNALRDRAVETLQEAFEHAAYHRGALSVGADGLTITLPQRTGLA